MHQRTHLLSTLVLAGLGLVYTASQDPGSQDPADQDEQDERKSAYAQFSETQVKRLREGIDGSWQLVSFQTASEFVDPEDFRGFAQFHADGHMTLFFTGAEDSNLIFQSDTLYTIFSGIYRYRISQDLTVQLASVMGVDNADGGNFLFHQAGETIEFEAILGEDELTLWEPGGYRFEFLKLRDSQFPEEAIERIRKGRTSYYDEDENERR